MMDSSVSFSKSSSGIVIVEGGFSAQVGKPFGILRGPCFERTEVRRIPCRKGFGILSTPEAPSGRRILPSVQITGTGSSDCVQIVVCFCLARIPGTFPVAQ